MHSSWETERMHEGREGNTLAVFKARWSLWGCVWHDQGLGS